MALANDDIEVGAGLVIPGKYLAFQFSHSSGPGGQNVNKTASRAELRFDFETAVSDGVIPGDVAHRLRQRSGGRITLDGVLRIVRQSSRDRLVNIELAREALAQLIREVLVPPKPRKATKPTRSSKAQRMDSKTKRGKTKAMRKRPPDWE